MIIYNYITTNLLNNKKYVGMHISSDVDDGYLGSGKALLAAVKKYGKENFIREVLCFCKTKEEAFKNEAVFIKEYNTTFPHGYNISPTGGAGMPGCFSEETLQKMSDSHIGQVSWCKGLTKETNEGLMRTSEAMKKKTPMMLGKTHSKETIQKMRESHTGKKYSNESKKKMSLSHMGQIAWNVGLTKETDVRVLKLSELKKGWNPSEETREKMSEARMGKEPWSKGLTKKADERLMKVSEAKRAKRGSPGSFGVGAEHPGSRVMLQYTLDGALLKEWGSAAEATRGMGKTTTGISRCARGDRPTAYGFIWKYKEIIKEQ